MALFSFRVAPGLRLTASSRGIRAGIGPRAARFHVGAGRPGISTGFGPLTVYQGLGASTRRTSHGPSPATLRRMEQVQAALDTDRILEQLLNVHLQVFSPAQPWRAEPPAEVNERAITKEHRREALRGIGFWKRAERRAAKRMAAERARDAIQRERARVEEARRERQSALDERWTRLLANDETVVLEQLEQAFADNWAPAAGVGADGDQVFVVVRYPTVEAVVPERAPDVTPTGKPTTRKRTKTERNSLYLAALCSTVLAVARETFAVCPGIATVTILAFTELAARPAPILAVTLARADTQTGKVEASAVEMLADRASSLLINQKGRARELAPLELDDEPSLGAFVPRIAESLVPHSGG
jgi:hypothetical protein